MTFNKKILSLIILFFGSVWIYLNIFFTPFYIWQEGVYRPWLFLNGFVLFRDIMWLRASFDLYLIAGFYKLFGVSPLNFQTFIFLVQALIGIIMFVLLYKKSFFLSFFSYIAYLFFAFIVYGSINQPAEILIGLFVFLIFYFYWQFIEKKNSKFLFFAGIATGLSLITKQTSLFILFATILLFLIYSRRELVRALIFYLFGTAIPILTYAGYFALNNGLYDLYQNAIYNTLVLYPKTQNISLYPVDFSEAIRIIGLHLVVLTPFIFIKTKIVSLPIKTALIIFIFSLFPTLLPAFLSYRLISALPIFCVMTAIFIIEGYSVVKKQKELFIKGVVVCGFIAFFVQLGLYSGQYFKFNIDNGGFFKQEYQIEYSKDEKDVAKWLKNNTTKKEKVFNIANNLIMFYADRLPQNKYNDSLVFEYYPISKYYQTITRNPARVVIFDSNIPKSLKHLGNWPYLQFLKKDYILAKTFGQYEVYILK